MARKVHRRPRAEQDLIDIWVYIARDNERAATRLLDQFDAMLKTLLEHPDAGRGRRELAAGIRSVPVGNYVLFYRPTDDGIELVRAINGHRDYGEDDFA